MSRNKDSQVTQSLVFRSKLRNLLFIMLTPLNLYYKNHIYIPIFLIFETLINHQNFQNESSLTTMKCAVVGEDQQKLNRLLM